MTIEGFFKKRKRKVFYNESISGEFTRDDCESGYDGETVTFTVEAGRFIDSTQEAANQLAEDYLNANGQAYANENGECIKHLFWNTSQSHTCNRTNCVEGVYGQPYTYTIAAGTYSSEISQADADEKALTVAQNDCESVANIHGWCCYTQGTDDITVGSEEGTVIIYIWCIGSEINRSSNQSWLRLYGWRTFVENCSGYIQTSGYCHEIELRFEQNTTSSIRTAIVTYGSKDCLQTFTVTQLA